MVAKRAIKNSIVLYIKMFVQIIISLYTTRVIFNALGISDFGIFNLLASAVAMFGFLRAALSSATLRFMAHAEGENNDLKKLRVFNSSIFLHAILTLFVFVLLELVLYFFFDSVCNIPSDRLEISKQVSHFIILMACFNIITVPFEAALNAHENMLFFSIIDVLKSILILILAFIIQKTAYDKLYVYCLCVMLITFIVFFIYAIYCMSEYKECKLNFQKYLDKACSKDMLSFSTYELMGFSTGMVGSYGTNILINIFFGMIVTAAQGIANQISGQLTSFSNTIIKALNPVIVKSQGAMDVYLFERSTVLGGKYSFLILSYFAVPFLIETRYILDVWLIKVPDWAVIFCRFQIVKNLLEQFTVTYGTAIGANGNIKNFAKVNSLNNLLPLPLIYFLFSLEFPPYMMYIVTIFFFSIINALINMYFTRKLLKFDIRRILSTVIIPGLTIFSIVFLISTIPLFLLQQGIFRLILVILLSLILFSLLTYLFLLDREEKSLIYEGYNKLRERF